MFPGGNKFALGGGPCKQSVPVRFILVKLGEICFPMDLIMEQVQFKPISRIKTFLLIVLLTVLFLFNSGADLVYESCAFSLLVGYHFFTDLRFSGDQIRSAGLMLPHLAVYLSLCTLVVWVTTEDAESAYWVIYLLPIAVAAANLSLKATLATCSVATLLFASLVPHRLYSDPTARREELPELMVFALTFFLVGVLIQSFSEQHRRQLEVEVQLNEKLHRQKTEQEESLARLEKAEETLRRRERLAALGEMAAGIAHEIRNPLGVVTSSVQLLESRLPDLKENQRRLFQIILEEIGRMNRLIGDFLRFSRPAQPHLVETDLAAFLRDRLDQIAPMAAEAGVEIRQELPGQPVPVWIDGELMQQAFLNLLLNALEASEKGDSLLVGLDLRNDQAVTAIRDSGGGIAAEDLPLIFNPFFTTKEGGTGLGLANAHRIIESHNGQLTVAANPDRGTTFTVKLPLQPPDQE